MGVINNKDVLQIICKTLGYINKDIVVHGEITGYILYNMLRYEKAYSEQELIDYTMIGILHDLGLFREPNIKNLQDYEQEHKWQHSVYGFLFLKNLTPLHELADIVLYHHLDYNRYPMIQSKNKQIIEYLNLADQMDAFMHMSGSKTSNDYFVKYRNIKFSGRAVDIFFKAEAKYKITKHMMDGSYKEELNQLLQKRVFTENNKRQMLQMLVFFIDFRSESTVIHSMATTFFARQLGKLMHLSSNDLYNLYYGALLHDIGKIGIPLSILESKNRLTDEEMKIMKAHARMTEMILEGVVDEEVVKISARHHEKLDGSGYHRGLDEKDLTLPQRIVAVADILSALYGKRSYKDAFSEDKIKAIVQGDAKNHKIDSEVVSCLIRNYKSIISNFEKEEKNTIGIYLNIKAEYDIIIEKIKEIVS